MIQITTMLKVSVKPLPAGRHTIRVALPPGYYRGSERQTEAQVTLTTSAVLKPGVYPFTIKLPGDVTYGKPQPSPAALTRREVNAALERVTSTSKGYPTKADLERAASRAGPGGRAEVWMEPGRSGDLTWRGGWREAHVQGGKLWGRVREDFYTVVPPGSRWRVVTTKPTDWTKLYYEHGGRFVEPP